VLIRDKNGNRPERSHEVNALVLNREARARGPESFPSHLLHLHLSFVGTTERSSAIHGAAHGRRVGNEQLALPRRAGLYNDSVQTTTEV
jgi:hypothetical protein